MSSAPVGSASGIRAARAWVELVVDNSKLSRGLQRAELELKAFANKLTGLGTQMFGMGAAMLTPIGYAVRQFAELDDTLRLVRAVTRATSREFDALSAKARFLGKTTSFTSQQVAEAMANLGRAGFDPRQIDGMIKHVMNLARATQTNVSTAAEITGNAMRQFGMEAKDSQRIVDVLTTAANNSSQTLEDIAVSFKYAAPVAKEFGMAIEEVAYYVGVLANQGLKGEMAGTSLRNILARLGGDDVRKQFYDTLGIKLHNAQGQVKGLKDLLSEANAEMNKRGWDALQRQNWLHKTFGLRSMAGGAKLTSVGNQYQALFEALMNADGAAQRTADDMDKGIGGAIRITKSAVQELANVIAESLIKELKELATWVQQAANKLITFFKYNREVVTRYAKIGYFLAKWGAIFFAAGAALRTVGTIAGSVATAFGMLTSAVGGIRMLAFTVGALGANLGTALGFTSALSRTVAYAIASFGTWGVVITGVAVALGALFKQYNKLKTIKIDTVKQDAADTLRRSYSEDETSLNRLIQISKTQQKSNDLLEEASNIINDLQSKYGDLGLSVNRVTREVEGLTDEQRKLYEMQLAYRAKQSSANLEAIEELRANNVEFFEKLYKQSFYEDERGLITKLSDEILKRGGNGMLDITDVYNNVGRFAASKSDQLNSVKQYLGVGDNYLSAYGFRKDENGQFNDISAIFSSDGKVYLVPFTDTAENPLVAQINEIFQRIQAGKQKIFNYVDENKLFKTGISPQTAESLQTISQEFPIESWRSTPALKSVKDVLADLEKGEMDKLTPEAFDEFRWNLANAADTVLEERDTLLSLIETQSKQFEKIAGDSYTHSGGFRSTELTRIGMFGALGYLGENKISTGAIYERDSFLAAVNDFKSNLISKAGQGSEQEQAYRMLMMSRLDEFKTAYLAAIDAGTQINFDFSPFADLMSYEVNTLLKDRLADLQKAYNEKVAEIEKRAIETVDESNNLGYKIQIGVDAEGEPVYYDNGAVVGEATKNQVVGSMKASETQPLVAQSKVVAGLANLLVNQRAYNLNVQNEERIREAEAEAPQRLAEAIDKAAHDFTMRLNKEGEDYGLGNALQNKLDEIADQETEMIRSLESIAEDAIRRGVGTLDGQSVDEWIASSRDGVRQLAEAAREQASIEISSENTLRRTQEKTHEYLLEILRKMDRDYNLQKSKFASQYGGGNAYYERMAEISQQNEDAKKAASERTQKAREAGEDIEGLDPDVWEKREYKMIDKVTHAARVQTNAKFGLAPYTNGQSYEGPSESNPVPSEEEYLKSQGAGETRTPQEIHNDEENLKLANSNAASATALGAKANNILEQPIDRKEFARANRARRKEYRRRKRELQQEQERAHDEFMNSPEEINIGKEMDENDESVNKRIREAEQKEVQYANAEHLRGIERIGDTDMSDQQKQEAEQFFDDLADDLDSRIGQEGRDADVKRYQELLETYLSLSDEYGEPEAAEFLRYMQEKFDPNEKDGRVFASKARKEADRIRKDAQSRENEYRNRFNITDYDLANYGLDRDIASAEERKQIAESMGDEQGAANEEAYIQEANRQKTMNDYYKALDNIDSLEKRRNKNLEQYENDTKDVEKQEKKIADQEEKIRQMEEEGLGTRQAKIDLEKDKADLEKMKRRQQDSLARFADSNMRYGSTANFIAAMNAYNTRNMQPLWDVNQSVTSKGTFDAYELFGSDRSTVTTEMKEQTAILSNIEDYVSSMASGEYI